VSAWTLGAPPAIKSSTTGMIHRAFRIFQAPLRRAQGKVSYTPTGCFLPARPLPFSTCENDMACQHQPLRSMQIIAEVESRVSRFGHFAHMDEKRFSQEPSGLTGRGRPSIRNESASWFCVFRSSTARPTDTPVYASSDISGQLMERLNH
jgi:hypothetical protein